VTRPNRIFAWILGIVLVVLGLMRLLTLYTDYLWMGSVGQQAVFTKLLCTKVGLGLVMGIVFFAWLWLNLRLARRKPAEDVTLIGKRLLPDEDREQIEQYADKALLIFCIIGALFAAFYAAAQALPLLQFLNAVPFGKADALFGNDAGFYIFRLPFLVYLYRSAMYMVVIALIAVVLIHLYQENIRLVGNTVHANSRARKQVLILLGLALLVKIYGYRLAMYNLLYSSTGKVFSGASYADVHARLPVLWLMMAVALGTAVIVLATINRRNFKAAGWALGVLIVVSLLGGTVYPAAIQRLVVIPNQLEKEQPYLRRNIEATRDSFGLTQVHRRTYTVATSISPQRLDASRETLKSVRLWDYRPLETTFDMLQTLRSYYSFPGVDVDRYEVGGELRQVSISARQLDYTKLPAINWLNQHLIYTHGYGAVVSPVNEADSRGLPVFWVSGLPPVTTVPQMEIKQPAVYYQSAALPPLIELVSSPPSLPTAGQEQPAPATPGGPGAGPPAAPPPVPTGPLYKQPAGEVPYVLVNTNQPELDYPSLGGTNQAAGSDQNKMTSYQGQGGVVLNSFFRRLAFAARFSDLQILLTTYLKPDSRIQINRYLPQQLSAVAPFMIYDPDPYLVVEDGRLRWICDAYTASSRYPYATLASQVSTDAVNLPGVNYLRNAVKVVVDAYDGIPTFYVVDPQDPMVQCYRKIFPTLFTDQQQMTPTIRRHLRYPLLQFLTQAKVYGLYHIEDTTTYFSREDQWAVPPEVYQGAARPTEPYYVVMQLPGADRQQFLVMLPFVLKGREERVAVAWMAAICDDPDYGRLVVYDFPKGEAVMGPMQFEGLIDQNTQISQDFTLWNQSGSRVVRGNTLMIPIDGNMLYVEPVYLVSTEKNAIPQLQRVIVAHGEKIVMEPTLDEALTRLFGVQLDLAAGGPQKIIVSGPGAGAAAPTVTPPAPGGAGVAPVAPSEGNRELIQRANQAFQEGDAARRQGDLATYQQKMEEVGRILKQLETSG
jgi:uncharacterized membrane protein (UPF0182 family)